MGNKVLDINTDAVVHFSDMLDKVHRSALPSAVRNTLNSAAFDVKTNTMPKQANAAFLNRKPNFFKANSKVVPARGFKIHSMVATVGFVSRGGNDKSVDELEQQEHGGNIGGRAFIPLKGARGGKSWKGVVTRGNRITNIGNRIVDSKKANGSSKRQKFIKSAIHAGKGGYVLGNHTNRKGNRTLYKITSVRKKKGNTTIKTRALYSVRSNRSVNVKDTSFMKIASLNSADNLEQLYIKAAKYQLKKFKKRL